MTPLVRNDLLPTTRVYFTDIALNYVVVLTAPLHITFHFKGNAIFEVTHSDLQRPLPIYKVQMDFYMSSVKKHINIEETAVSPYFTWDLWLFYCPIYQLSCCRYTKIYTFMCVVRREGDIP